MLIAFPAAPLARTLISAATPATPLSSVMLGPATVKLCVASTSPISILPTVMLDTIVLILTWVVALLLMMATSPAAFGNGPPTPVPQLST
jgi:hypothetical protein